MPEPATASIITPASSPREGLPDRIENYRILRKLGAGGMGVVFEAEQQNPRRLVALKVINAGVSSREALRRFQHEAQVLGRLHHGGIAQIFEAGMFDAGEGGRPFFAMELIRGASITNFSEFERLASAQRLELLARVCDAVHHAHLKGIIHRDLKPANILVTREGQPKVLDFGVARATDSDVRATTLQTQADQLIGTLPYMSPEQALGDSDELDVRSDVYALGVVGYELLTGRLPYHVDRRTVFEAVRVIREEEPTRLSAIDRSYRGDVETIFAKALEKDRNRRYQSASDFAADIRRFLNDEPIVARPPSISYQLGKFARRHKAVVVAAMSVLAVLVAGVIVTTVFAMRENKARILAQSETEKARLAMAHALRESEQAHAARTDAQVQAEKANTEAENAKRARADAQAAAERAQTEADKANAISSFHRTMLSRANPAFAQGRDVTVREVLDQSAGEIGSMFPNQPQVEGTIRTTIGESYLALSEYPPAVEQFERAAQLIRQALGEDNAETLSAEANLGVAYHDVGRMDESLALTRSVLERRIRILGANDPATIGSRVNLASALADMGKHEEAETVFREALQQSTDALGEEHRTTLTAMGGLAVLLKRDGRYDESAELFKRTIELSQKSLGENDHDTLADIDNYAGLLHLQGKFDESQKMLEDLLERHVRVYGPTHAATLIVKNNLAISFQNNGRLEQAEAMFRSVVEDGRKRFGEGHPDVLVATANLRCCSRKRSMCSYANLARRIPRPSEPWARWALCSATRIRSTRPRCGIAAPSPPPPRPTVLSIRRRSTLRASSPRFCATPASSRRPNASSPKR
jgi:tetratricopeptide (TPR) repeat protein